VIALGFCGAGAGFAQSPAKSSRSGFRLFARSLVELSVNRVSCGMSSGGEICTDPLGSNTIGGGRWPKGTLNQYVFNSGTEVAGIIGPDGGPWAGDTAGAYFFMLEGLHDHGVEIRPIHDATNTDDLSAWPAEGRIPSSSLYHPSLHDRISASDGDMWWLMWEGDPQAGSASGRPHPLGVLVDTRALAWNHPSENEDIIYLVSTFYNISSLDPANYVAAPPALQPILLDYAQRFHDLNNAHFGVTLPPGGYTIAPMVAGYSADMDVASAGSNWASVHVPLALGTTYDGSFDRFQGWTFDPALTSEPFFPGSGFAGIKFLRGLGNQYGIQLYSNNDDGGAAPHLTTAARLFRWFSGTPNLDLGDEPCNSGDPLLTHICIIIHSRNWDARFWQSARPTNLAAGASTSLVAAYVFASPRSTGGCPTGPCADLPPGQQVVADTAIHGNAALMMNPGVFITDSVAGYLGFDDADGDGIVTQYEYLFEPRSLFGKALLAQAFFDNQFLTPTKPEAPDFFLVPGDGKVTVMWRPSPSETTGDPYFEVAKDATWIPPGGTVPTPNPLYDPNFRQFDVEGYRIYRGRVEDPEALTLLAQFDYAGTTISDFGGQVFNTSPFGIVQPPDCAPEVGITTECPVAYDPIAPGITRTVHNDFNLSGWISQVRFGDRIALSDGSVLVLRADTAETPLIGSYKAALSDNGVPFVFVDSTARNSFRYFYSVSAFDLNSWQSGPSSLESPKVLKQVTPSNRAVNYENTATDLVAALYGRGVELCTDREGANPCRDLPVPDINPTTGTFSGPMPPADGWGMDLFEFVPELFTGPGSAGARLDSIQLGNGFWGNAPDVYWYTATSVTDRVTFSLSHLENNLEAPPYWRSTSMSSPFDGAAIDPGLASRYGGDANYHQQARVSMSTPGYYLMSGTGRSSSLNFNDGVPNEALWDGSFYDGPRWYDGANESFPNPTGGNCAPNCDMTVTGNFNNGGSLAGVTTIHQPYSYTTMNFSYREFQGAAQGAQRAADMRVYWGASGTVDSVVDLTHNVLVQFKATAGGSWGFLNFSAQTGSPGSDIDDPTILSIDDFVCVAPFHLDQD
ncbi:MAG: hypothetical protein HKM89_15440, partial [Gemmatimonadales bacterium]|nr:hypothetical protein [Gemmatimonadales bacterium]